MATAAEKRAALKANQGAKGQGTDKTSPGAKPPRAARQPRQRDSKPPTETEKLNDKALQRPDQVGDAHGEIARPSSAGQKCIVGFKAGIAYLDIQLQQKTVVQENTQTGPRDVNKFDRVGNVVRIRGTAYPRGTPPKGFPPPPVIVDGAALNPGIDRDFMENWLRQNRLNPLVQNRMIFIAGNDADAAAMAREDAKNVSGMDPLSTDGKDPRLPKPTRAELTDIETSPRM